MKNKFAGGRAGRKSSNGAKIFIVVVNCINLILSIVLAVLNRQQALKAIEDDEGVKVLLAAKSEKHEL